MMRLIGQDVLSKAARKHPDSRAWLKQWVVVVESAAWRSLDELRVSYPSADGVTTKSKTVVTVFNVRGNTYRLLSYISYALQTVEALDLLTHAEYSKDFWKSRY